MGEFLHSHCLGDDDQPVLQLQTLFGALLRDKLLRARYEEIASAVREQLTRGVPVENLMGGSTDALKLVSSLTLFCAAAQSLAGEDPTFDSLAQRCDSILGRTSAQGYPPCAQTLTRLKI